MSFKEDPRKQKVIFNVHYFREKKIDFLVNHVKIHVIYVKKFLTKIEI